jgi:uncharacterized cofD-like protein
MTVHISSTDRWAETADPVSAQQRVVALGGGHGLAANLSALRRLAASLTAVVTVADNGGSSGRLREELGVLPPGDLRQALAALCRDDEWGRTWARLLQHRFTTGGALDDHAVGNLLIVALWQLLDGHVAGLDWVARLLGAQGRVLPMAAVPLDIEADVIGAVADAPHEVTTVRGQVEVATTRGIVQAVRLVPNSPPACLEAVTAIEEADWVILGPGSWYTSVLPHLLVPDLRHAVVETSGKRCVTLNIAPQVGETDGFTPNTYLEVLAVHAPDLRLDAVLADSSGVADLELLEETVSGLGAELVMADVGVSDGSARHDPVRLAAAYEKVLR